MNSPYDIVISLLRTEKGTDLLPLNKYIFFVNKKANKFQIKKAVEQIYKVKVSGVNTQVASGKLKRVRYQSGRTPDWKKAIVTLRQGQQIEVT